MNFRATTNRIARSVSATGQWLTVLALSTPVLSCNLLDKGLAATAPDKIETSVLETPANAGLLVNSAIGNFQCALGAFVVVGGLMSGELVESTSTASRWPYDRRDVDPTGDRDYQLNACDDYALGVYTPIQVARGTTERALELLQGWTDAQVPNRQDLIAKAAAYAGYSRILLAEELCEAAINVGPKMTSAQILASAEEKFNTAITAAQAASDNQMLNMAYVGRARARLDQGNKAGAASDAALVTSGFVINASAETSPGRRQNRVNAQNQGAAAVSVAPAYRNVTATSTGGTQIADPRVSVTSAGKNGADNRTPLYYQQKYPTTAAPLPIAGYKEAQLIIAEVSGGQTAVNIINTFHAAAGLAPFASTDPATIQAQVVEERRRELFLEGQHLYDTRRLNLPFDVAPQTPYSVVTPKGGVYGTERCLPLPDVERLNNPNIGG